MKRNLTRTLLAILFLLSIPLTTHAYSFSVDGIYYNRLSDGVSLAVTYMDTNYNSYSGSVTIPSQVTYSGTTYSVTKIGNEAFYKCTGLTSLTIPNSVTSIGDSAFDSCTGLTSVTIPNSVTSIGEYAFYNCTGLTSVTIPNSVTSIGHGAFYGCTSLTSVTIPKSITEIGDYAFYNCTGLTSVIYNAENCTSMGRSNYPVFKDCSNLTTLTIGESVKSIPGYAFSGCTGLTSVTIPYSVTYIGDEAFYECTGLTSVTIPNSVTLIGKYAFKGCSNAKIDAFPLPYISLKNSASHNWKSLTLVGGPVYDISSYNAHQESIDFVIKSINYEPAPEGYDNVEPIEMGIIYRWGAYPSNKDGKVTVNKLNSNIDYKFSCYTKYSNGYNSYGSKTITTKSLNLNVSNSLSPTSISAQCSYKMDDAKFESEYIKFNGEIISGHKLLVTGLKPETYYIAKYSVKTKGGSSEAKDFSFTTPALELAILKPSSVSSTCTIVAAETNMSDEETSAGFQWKKYDAPSTLEPNEAYAAIYDGRLEGYIKNLQSTSYYNVRAFYKASNGTYYYSDWKTFDPSDFSYFEPTVHTYAASEVTSNSASVKGYVLPGTDEIISQGIEYWPTGSTNAKKRAISPLTANNDVNTVFANGQVMMVTLSDLMPSTTYTYRAFVTTQAGVTYGEELSFTTEADAGIGTVVVTPERKVVGYYNLVGQRFTEPQHGLNIIVYSDGTAEKVMIKK